MILVTVGFHFQGFNRLVEAMDKVAAEIDERVIIQRGSSSYVPQHAEHFQWTSSQQMEQLTEEARIVVGHAGSGTIILTLLKGKPLIVVPRLKQYREHIDDHQLQLAKEMGSQGKAAVVYDSNPIALRAAIEKVAEQKMILNRSTSLVQALRRQLDSWV